jgi:lambda repressor-like predicted transcriptional regulator
MITEKIAMHPADIKAEIEKSGISQADLSRDLEVSKTVVNEVIYGRTTSRRIAEHIAKKIGKSLDDIWPGRYTDQAA